jgi:cell division protein FtsB
MSEHEESLIQQLIQSQQALTEQLARLVETNQELVAVNQDLIAAVLDDEDCGDLDGGSGVDLAGRPI